MRSRIVSGCANTSTRFGSRCNGLGSGITIYYDDG